MEMLMSAGLNILKNVFKDISSIDVDNKDQTLGQQASLEAIRRIENNLFINGSITKFTSLLIVNPEIIATSAATRSPAFDGATTAVVDVFSGFYLQAFQILTNLYGYSGIETIAVLKENKGDFGGKLAGKILKRTAHQTLQEAKKRINAESYHGLFNLDFSNLQLNYESANTAGDQILQMRQEQDTKIRAVENNKQLNAQQKKQEIEHIKAEYAAKIERIESEVAFVKDQRDQLQKQQQEFLNTTGANGARMETSDKDKDAKLGSVIRHLNVVLDIGATVGSSFHTPDGNAQSNLANAKNIASTGQGLFISKMHIPVTIVAGINKVQLSEIIDVLVDKSYKKTFAARWMEYKSGGITLSDLIFCTDLIKDYRKKHIKNSKDLTNRLEGKAVSRALSALIERTPHDGETSYNMIVITKDELYNLEKAFNGKISNPAVKDKILASLMAHSLTILDDEVERAVMYISDINGCIDVGYKKLNNGNKTNDLTDVMKYLMMNKTPEL